MMKFWEKYRLFETYKLQQNPEEFEAMGTQKEKLARLIIDTGCDKR